MVFRFPLCENGDQPLHKAVINGRDTTARLLIGRGADIHAPNLQSLTPLHLAALHVRDTIGLYLVSSGSKVDVKSRPGETPLQFASMHGHASFAQLLLDHGANIERSHNEGRSPLHHAIEQGHRGVVSLLLSKGAVIDMKPLYFRVLRETTLSAIPAASKEVIQHVFEASVSRGGSSLADFLHFAILMGFEPDLEQMKPFGINLNIVGALGWTALDIATVKQDGPMISFLRNKGARRGITNSEALASRPNWLGLQARRHNQESLLERATLMLNPSH